MSVPETLRTLATMRDGETLVVRHIFFDDVRARCARAGIAEGDQVRCREATPAEVHIETPRGAVVSVARRWGRFVQVEPEL